MWNKGRLSRFVSLQLVQIQQKLGHTSNFELEKNSMSNSNLEEEKTSQSVLWTSFSVKHIRWFRKFQSLFGKWKYIHSSKFEPQSHQSLPRKLHVRSRQPVKKEVRFPYLNIALLSNNQVFLNPLFVTLVFFKAPKYSGFHWYFLRGFENYVALWERI